eukprot:SAG31_NODE_295_length_18239_cov_15.063065_3_plen_122_part_00
MIETASAGAGSAGETVEVLESWPPNGTVSHVRCLRGWIALEQKGKTVAEAVDAENAAQHLPSPRKEQILSERRSILAETIGRTASKACKTQKAKDSTRSALCFDDAGRPDGHADFGGLSVV